MNGDTQQPVDGGQSGPTGQWQYRPDSAPSVGSDNPDNSVARGGLFSPDPNLHGVDDEVSWTASEYISHAKGPLWYVGFFIATGILAVVMFLWADLLSSITLVAFAVALFLGASRPPKVITYQVTARGLVAGDKLHPYTRFKSFVIKDEGAVSSIMLVPVGGMNLPVTAYYAPEDEKRIVAVVSQHLPMQPIARLGLVERVTRWLRL